MTKEVAAASLKTLSQLLEKHYGQKVILRISKECIFTGLNNLKIHAISDFRYDEYFGFTDTDVYCPWETVL